MENSENPVLALEIKASLANKITFASQQNNVAFIHDLSVVNHKEEDFENLELVLECEPALISQQKWKISQLKSGSEIQIRKKSVELSGAMLCELNEKLRAKVVLKLMQGDNILATSEHEVIGLARNEWGGAGYMPELLAAFCMPNDPAVTAVLRGAGEVLRRSGEQPSLDGYQSKSRKRVWQMVSSIWSAVSAKRLVYSEPPASFETEGQKVRTPSDIWEGGLVTCLDSALLFAAAFEQAGLYPVIAIVKGHALCGVWLQPQQLPSLITEDCIDIRKYISLNELVLFETTMVVSEPPISFSKAVAEGNRRVSEENEHDFFYALDIKQARKTQITPLAVNSKISGLSESPTSGDAILDLGLELAPNLPAFDLGVGDPSKADTPETRLDHWKRKLLDLTKRNRLLNLKPSQTAIRLYASSPAVLEDKLALGKKIVVIPKPKLTGENNTRDEETFLNRTGESFISKFVAEALERDEVIADLSQSEIDSGLVQLYRKAKTDIEEGGANTLYLAVGMLKWKQSAEEERAYRAPLLLVPVKLERANAASKVRITKHEDETVFNMTLLEMLRQDFELRIPELEGELPKDDSGVDVPLIWNIVRKAIKEVAGFEVVEEIFLSTFSFAKYLMWKDLADRTEVLKKNPFVQHLIENPRDKYQHSTDFIRADEIDYRINVSDLFMPLSSDSSQIVAIHASANGGDFALEGPPGTGKSQTISNIIAHNLALGKKVLFVSEKMTALEVVYKRLCDKGLGDFCLELHSNKANKREVLDQLRKSWKNRDVRTKDEWYARTQELSDKRDALNSFVEALHSESATGISPRMAIGRSVRWSNIHRLVLDWQGGLEADRARDKEGLKYLEACAKKLGQSYSEISEEDIRVFENIKNYDWSNSWQSRFVDIVKKLSNSIDRTSSASDSFISALELPLKTSSSISSLRTLAGLAKEVPNIASIDLSYAIECGLSLFETAEKGLDLLNQYNMLKKTLSCSYEDDLISAVPLRSWEDEWKKANDSSWPINLIKKSMLARTMRKQFNIQSLPVLPEDLNILLEMRRLSEEIDSLTSELPENTCWKGLKTSVDLFEESIKAGKALRECLARLSSDTSELIQIKKKLFDVCKYGRDAFQVGMPISNKAEDFLRAYNDLDMLVAEYTLECKADLIKDDLAALQEQAKSTIQMQARINSWCKWQEAKREAHDNGLESLVSAIENGVISPADSMEAFKTAYCSWVAERLIDTNPILCKFSAIAHEDLIAEFRALDQKVEDLSVQYIKAKLSGNIPFFDGKDRPQGYGVLSRELQKQMRHKPVRQLINEIGGVLTSLTPCLLMSPLSVSQFLSAENELFDLVVFDEASQIAVWDAVGAIARGKNVIVVGDPKQMPPTNFFDRGPSVEEQDDETGGTEDLESILDEALAAGVKLHRLTGHYRSKHESLIAFSNHRYYDGELVTYPASETKESVVSLRNVKGQYQRGKGRTNPIEAKAVVAEILRRLKDPVLSQLSIGVVTFNNEQRRLIEELLDDERRKDTTLEQFFESGSVEEKVVVKNLETVQGHERDVVILSVGFGPDAVGGRMPMVFGPLNRKGGERRLNVAITRAKSEMIIFTSFDPDEIDLSRTSSKAVKDLKDYLVFAQRGPVALAEAIESVGGYDDYDSDFEKAVAEALRAKGWIVHTQIGVSKFRIDLGIVHPKFSGRYFAGVECDGAAYHSSPSAKDRDRIRHSILEGLGWNLIRIWSTDFFIDPVRSIEKVHLKLMDLLAQDDALLESGDISLPVVDDILANDLHFENKIDSKGDHLPDLTSVQSGNSGYQSIQIATGIGNDLNNDQLSPGSFYDPSYQVTIKRLACEIIDNLGPITFMHLSEKIARAHGFQRTGSQIKSQIWGAISSIRRHNKTDDGHTVLWPESMMPQETYEYRGLSFSGSERDWSEVPYPEKLSLAISVSDLDIEDGIVTMAAKIGLGRLHSKTKEEIQSLILLSKHKYAA